ncbi:guanine nucleotide-binding protein subunit alpha [Sporobolomyces salmoneus]|uniref:guanine nucleotide-binding protein subunit alpha n=1 Tax=Sporobolomyces salmoneus TaxID=183962 RepID=UPI0031805368
MGACGSSEQGGGSSEFQPTMEELHRSKAIEKMLREEERKLSKEVKVLLLGPGSSGKSTILVIHLSGFTPHELESYRQQIFVNVRDGISAVFILMDEFRIEVSDPSLRSIRYMLDEAGELREGEPFPQELYFPIRSLWRDPGVQLALSKGTEATIPENMTYFYSHLERLFHPSYQPTDQDVLRCRQKTTGITETVFESRDLQYRIFDVGGQRSERKKWIHCFESVTAVLFLAAVSGYDQVLLEDPDSNQMQEALMLFDSICNSQWFVKTSIIFFLNKVDVLKERILTSPVRAHFPDYQGPDADYNAVKEFFKVKFTRLNRSTSKEVYCHFTTAIDTQLLRVVMTSVYDIILNRNLEAVLF